MQCPFTCTSGAILVVVICDVSSLHFTICLAEAAVLLSPLALPLVDFLLNLGAERLHLPLCFNLIHHVITRGRVIFLDISLNVFKDK
jgi:hypothetical protein